MILDQIRNIDGGAFLVGDYRRGVKIWISSRHPRHYRIELINLSNTISSLSIENYVCTSITRYVQGLDICYEESVCVRRIYDGDWSVKIIRTMSNESIDIWATLRGMT